jgi:RNA methyltransferase, TrmH family
VTQLGSRNPAVQHLRRLARRRSARSDTGTFVIDGPLLVDEALRAGVPIDTAFVDVEAVADRDEVITRLRQAGVVVRLLAPGVLASAAATVTPNGIAVVARQPARSLDEVLAGTRPFVVVLAGVADPGNAGTLLRSAEASGATAVLAAAGSVDLLSPKAVRASAGAVFHVPVVNDVEPNAAIDALRRAGFVLYGTAAQGGTPYDTTDWSGAVAVVLGNEAHGVGEPWHDAIDHWVTIPMVGRAESLNVAMAGTLLCFMAARQRRTGE